MRQYSNQSRDAALAAWAAWDQGKFWEMHDLLFERAPELDRAAIDGIAKKLGLDMAKFGKAMDGQEKLGELQQNLDRIHALDIWGTPTTIINGEIIKGAMPYETYRDAVKKALAEAGVSRLGPAVDAVKDLLAFLAPRDAYAEEKVFGQGKVPLYVAVGRLKPTNEPKVGEEAPDFTLPGIFDQNVTLSSFRGKKNVLLTFLPAAFTPV